VLWVAPADGTTPGREPFVVLGRGRTGPDGLVEISPSSDPAAHAARCRLTGPTAPSTSLVLAGGHGGPADGGVGVQVRLGVEPVELEVADRDAPDAGAWALISSYLAANRLDLVSDLTSQLVQPSPDNPASLWSPTLRAGALAILRRDLGPAVAFDDGEYAVDLLALAEGDTTTALTRYRSLEDYVSLGGQHSAWLDGSWFVKPASDRTLYRDYLRSVWVTAARRMHGPGPSDSALEHQLSIRFAQDFQTTDDTERAAAALVIPIVAAALTTPEQRGGFGLAPTAVPARGTASDAEHLAHLVVLTGESAEELRNRYRVRVVRRPEERTSPVELNVEALLGLLADTYQSPEEPFATPLRGLEPGKPLIFGAFVGRAPFFLQYEEWLERQGRFFPENVYDIRRTLPWFDKDYRDGVSGQKAAVHPETSPNNDHIASSADWHASAAWLERIFGITDTIRAALTKGDEQRYGEAIALLDVASAAIADAVKARQTAWKRDTFLWISPTGVANSAADRRVGLRTRAARPVKTPAQLAELEAFFDARMPPKVYGWQNGPDDSYMDWLESWLARARALYGNELRYWQHVLVPYLRACLLAVQGHHAAAIQLLGRITGYVVGVAEATDLPGYLPGNTTLPLPLRGSALPYTTEVTFDPETHWYADQRPHNPDHPPLGDVTELSDAERPILAPFEQRFFALAQGEHMLAWADALYRTDEPSALLRARELYKGVVFLHGEDPGIAPRYPVPGGLGLGLGLGGGLDFVPGGPVLRNPAKASQVARARAAAWQIDAGLNVYGYGDDVVPILRYKPLKEAADVFATSAKAAQADFLQYQTRFEQATIEGWQAATMVKRAKASAGIAAEQVHIAQAGVAKAEEQVKAVEAQIAAKKQEIADADSLFGQAKAFFGGMKDSLSGMVPLAEKAGNDTSPATSGVDNKQLMALLSKSTSGASASKEAAAAALGSGAALTIGFAAFAYYGYTTMDGMADAAARRDGELKALQEGGLAAARGQVRLKERDVTIARHAQDIAAADLELALALDRYQRDRFLNVDLWNKLAAFAQRTMRRYVELGAAAAWFAERALAFEQRRNLDVIRLDYLPAALRGLTGADRLLLDLSELEAKRLQGIRLSTPVKHTVSLARDFPVAFGQLKATGRCRFHTRERPLQEAYPGTSGYRLRAVTVGAHDADGPSPRGVLRNLGLSTVTGTPGSAPSVLVRFPDALPLSEFRLHDDLAVYDLPGEALLQFEGSGVETDWELELPAIANPRGLRSLADVLVTFDMNAHYNSPGVLAAGTPPVPVSRSVALAASVWDPAGLASLRDPATAARVTFDLAALALPAAEADRRVANVALLAVGRTDHIHAVALDALTSGIHADVDLVEGLALSNAGPLLGTAPARPLNALVGVPADQAFRIEIDRTNNEEVRELKDLVLVVEYTAEL